MHTDSQCCLGRYWNRRAVLHATLATGALGFPFAALQKAAQAATARGASKKQRSLILLWQDGGASHFETFDPKPAAPSEYRGELDAIRTALPGTAFCEVLPRLAQLADRMSIIRSLHQPSSDHVVGSHNVLTGWYGQSNGGKSRYPDLASVISYMRSSAMKADVAIGASTDPRIAAGMRAAGSQATANGDPMALPGYIDISKGLHRGGPAFLGPLHSAFQVAGDPAKPGFAIQNLQSIGSVLRFQERQAMLRGLDRLGGKSLNKTAGFESFHAVDGFRQQAIDLLTGGGGARAFDLAREPSAVRDRYGRHLAGQQCLLARRLIEAGVGVVAVRFTPDGRGDYDRTMIGWDDHAVHGNIFAIMRKRGPQFDQAVSALIEDLEQRGLRDEVLLVVVGEFGRTPRIHVHKGCPGREHWGPAGCALIYGGGLTMGQVIGSTTAKGERPQDRPLSYQDLLATMYQAMGVDFHRTLLNHVGRPTPILADGQPIEELTGWKETNRDLLSPQSMAGPTPSLAPLEASTDPETLVLPMGATNAQLSACRRLSEIKTLIARDTAIDDSGLAVLSRCKMLKELHLNGTPVSDAGLRHLSDVDTLEVLHISGASITDSALKFLIPLSRLRQFSFDGSSISLPAVLRLFIRDQRRSLGDALSAMALTRRDAGGHVVRADLAGVAFTDEFMERLGDLPMLRELQLTGTQVTDVGLQHLINLPELEELYLAKCDIGDEGLRHVASLRKLRAINLYGTRTTSAGLKHLKHLTELRLLMITDLKLKPAVVQELKDAIPQLTVTDFTSV